MNNNNQKTAEASAEKKKKSFFKNKKRPATPAKQGQQPGQKKQWGKHNKPASFNPYDNRSGAQAIVNRRPVWNTATAGTAPPAGEGTPLPQQPLPTAAAQAGHSSSTGERPQNKKGQNRALQGRPVQGRPGGTAAGQSKPVQGRPGGAAAGQSKPVQGRPGGTAAGQSKSLPAAKGSPAPTFYKGKAAAAPQPKADENGIFNFSEQELAEDSSIRVISRQSGETKFASFDEYLKNQK